MNYKDRRKAVIVDVLDERQQQIKLRDANYSSNGALFHYLKKKKQESEEKKADLRGKWNDKKNVIRFRLGLKT